MLSFELVDEVWFCDNNGLHKGYIEKFNKNTINVLVDDDSRPECYQLWRVEEYFLSKDHEEAKAKWEDYKLRLNEFKRLLNMKRKQHHFFQGLSVLVEPFNSPPYKAMVLNVGKATLELATEDGRFMKVDKALCTPINEPINFQGGFF